jgi:predicted nucleotidyltransferase
MAKTVTLRLADEVYDFFLEEAKAENRPLWSWTGMIARTRPTQSPDRNCHSIYATTKQRPNEPTHEKGVHQKFRRFHFFLSCGINPVMAQRTFQHLEMVRRILLKRLQKYNARIYLFGSMARGEVRRTSDIDIAVLPVGNLPDGVFSQIREDLENSRVPYRVELIDLAKASPSFSAHVQKVGIPWNG